MLRDESNEIQAIIEGDKKNIEIIELIDDDDDAVMKENSDDVIEIGHFPPNLQSIDFFDQFTPPIIQPISENIKQDKLNLAFELAKKLTKCNMCKDSFCMYDGMTSRNCMFCAGICNNSTCELKHIATNCAKSQCYGIEFEWDFLKFYYFE